jgi:ATP synthase protein I
LLDATVGTTPPDRTIRSDRWDDDPDEEGGQPFRRWTHEEVQASFGPGASNPYAVSPWRVVTVQVVVGLALALVAGLVTSRLEVFWSALYGAGVVVVPGALMARGMTSRLTSLSPGVSAVSVMLWSSVKIGVSIVMLMLAPKLVQRLSWPVLLATMVTCMLVYWFALVKRSH